MLNVKTESRYNGDIFKALSIYFFLMDNIKDSMIGPIILFSLFFQILINMFIIKIDLLSIYNYFFIIIKKYEDFVINNIKNFILSKKIKIVNNINSCYVFTSYLMDDICFHAKTMIKAVNISFERNFSYST